MVKILITVLVSWNRSRKKNYRLISYRIFRNLLNHSKRILLLLYKEQSAVVSLGSTPIWTNPNWTTPNWTTPNWTYPIWTWSTPCLSIDERCQLVKVVYWWKLSIDKSCLLMKVVDWWKLWMKVVYLWKLSINENCLLMKVVYWWKLK